MATGNQKLRNFQAALGIVAGHAGDAAAVISTIEQHHGQTGLLALLGKTRRQAGGDQDQCFNAVTEYFFKHRIGIFVIGGGEQQYAIAQLFECRRQGLQHRGIKRVLHAGCDHADQIGATLDQRACPLVGSVTQGRRRRLDFLASLGRNAGALGEGSRDRRLGDTRHPGHVMGRDRMSEWVVGICHFCVCAECSNGDHTCPCTRRVQPARFATQHLPPMTNPPGLFSPPPFSSALGMP
ncbi:hypothetical protein D3C86_1397410 [compost metagenome]